MEEDNGECYEENFLYIGIFAAATILTLFGIAILMNHSKEYNVPNTALLTVGIDAAVVMVEVAGDNHPHSD